MRYRRIAVGVLAVSVSAVLLTYLGLGVFSAPAADDYCYAIKARRLGFVPAQLVWYQNWSGRYASTALLSAIGLTDLERTYPAFGIATLVLTYLSILALVAAATGNRFGLSGTALGAGVLSVLFLAGLPDVAQTIYWLTGSVMYQVPNVELTLLVAILVHRELGAPSAGVRSLLWIAGTGLVVLIVGANEVSLALTLLLLCAGTVSAFRSGRGTAGFWAGLLALAAIASAASVLAPGNRARATAIAADVMLRPQPWLAAALYLPWTLLRLAYWSSSLGLWTATVLLLGASWQWARSLLSRDGGFDRRYLRIPAAWIAGVLLLSLIGFAINRYPLPERAESIVWLLFLLGWFPSAVVLAHWCIRETLEPYAARLFVPAVLLLALCTLGAPNNFEAFKDSYRGYRFYLEMGQRRELIREAKGSGRLDVMVPSLSRTPRTLLATELTTDPTDFRNACLADYHGLRTIRLGLPG